MPTLQIRNVPEELYQLLKERSREEHRSITRQALVELQRSLEKGKRDETGDYLEGLRNIRVPAIPEDVDFESVIRRMRDSR